MLYELVAAGPSWGQALQLQDVAAAEAPGKPDTEAAGRGRQLWQLHVGNVRAGKKSTVAPARKFKYVCTGE